MFENECGSAVTQGALPDIRVISCSDHHDFAFRRNAFYADTGFKSADSRHGKIDYHDIWLEPSRLTYKRNTICHSANNLIERRKKTLKGSKNLRVVVGQQKPWSRFLWHASYLIIRFRC